MNRPAIFYPAGVALLVLTAPFSQAESRAVVSANGLANNNISGPQSEGTPNRFSLDPGNPASYTYSSAGVTGFVTGTVEADFGVNRIFNRLSRPSLNSGGGFASSVLQSGWADTLTINHPTLTGQTGFYRGSVIVDMVFSVTNSPGFLPSNNSFSVSVRDSLGGSSYASLSFSDNTGAQSYQGSVVNFTIPFTFGTPFTVAVQMSSNIELNNPTVSFPDGGTLTHDASNTARWGGTVSVSDSGDAIIPPTAYTLTSHSGVNYTGPISGSDETFAEWVGGFDLDGQTGLADDFDNDGLPNAVENLMGTDPAKFSEGLRKISSAGGNLTFRHNLSPTPATDLDGSYEWSHNLKDWHASGVPNAGINVTFGTPVVVVEGSPDLVSVTAAVTGTSPGNVFFRFKATKD